MDMCFSNMCESEKYFDELKLALKILTLNVEQSHFVACQMVSYRILIFK